MADDRRARPGAHLARRAGPRRRRPRARARPRAAPSGRARRGSGRRAGRRRRGCRARASASRWVNRMSCTKEVPVLGAPTCRSTRRVTVVLLCSCQARRQAVRASSRVRSRSTVPGGPVRRSAPGRPDRRAQRSQRAARRSRGRAAASSGPGRRARWGDRRGAPAPSGRAVVEHRADQGVASARTPSRPLGQRGQPVERGARRSVRGGSSAPVDRRRGRAPSSRAVEPRRHRRARGRPPRAAARGSARASRCADRRDVDRGRGADRRPRPGATACSTSGSRRRGRGGPVLGHHHLDRPGR